MIDSLNEKNAVEKETSRIRPAESGDLPAMTQLLQELFAIETDFAGDAEKQRWGLLLLLADPNAEIWVAEHYGCVVGMVTVQLMISTAEGGLSGLLEDLIVSATCRRRGLGKELVDAAVNWCRAQGATRSQLLADRRNAPALDFYQSQDWTKTNMIALRRPL